MKVLSTVFAVAWLFVSGMRASSAEVAVEKAAVLAPGSRLWLEGDSTIHPFSIEATTIDLDLATEPGAPLGDGIRSGKMRSLSVRVPVAEMASGKGGLDKRMRKALKSDENPDILFEMSDYNVEPSTTAGRFMVRANGHLSVAGERKLIDVAAEVTAGETVRIAGSEDVLMTDHGVKPPSFMGAVKTQDRIVVKFDLHLTRP